MFKAIRTSKATKIFIYYLVIMMFLEITQPMKLYALTEGPKQPEFNSFTPIGTSDMVDLASGDLNYNIPIMDVGGYPINLSYNSGVTMDQEASWVGLGWNLNIGQINRTVRGVPDDFKGDEIETQNNLKPNVTVAITPYINPQAWGLLDNTVQLGAGLEVSYNNYTGLAASPSFGAGFKLSQNVTLGLQLSTSDAMGASISPSVSMNVMSNKKNKYGNLLGGNLTGGITYNSRQALQNFNLSSSLIKESSVIANKKNQMSGSGGGSISFINNTFTPTKRLAFNNNQFTFSFSMGPSFWGTQVEGSLTASATIQTVKDKFKKEKAFGYENTELASDGDVLDFNRENELNTVTKNTNVLPVTNYTYDILTIQSQNMGGQIRPYRGQAGYVYEPYVGDQSTSTNLSGEFEAGWGWHYGASIKHTRSVNYTSPWETIATPYLKDKVPSNIDYEKVYYKSVGEERVDPEYTQLFTQNFGGDKPITLTLSDKNALNKFSKKVIQGYNSNLAPMPSFNTSKLRRVNRDIRNKSIQKVTKKEASDYGITGKFIKENNNALDHHTAGYLITDENGNRNVFGETAYNLEKNETTFATNSTNIDCLRGVVFYNSGENSMSNSSGIDHYFNNVKTKQYAHTYLLSSVLSSDYQDVDNNGPSDNDLGTYTKFTYTSQGDIAYNNNYKWRVPFGRFEASHNEGFKSDRKDQKGSYLYGVKEVKYIKRIETKTHVALIDLEERKDGYGVTDKDGGLNLNNKSYYIKTIRLYAKRTGTNIPDNITLASIVKPIKIAHFEYDYSLCPGVDNNRDNYDSQNNYIPGTAGKLTLKKVYFTYENSKMGKYTPYVFQYGNNERYNPKNYDIWGNYKSIVDCQALSPQDFPYVEQNNIAAQNVNATTWTLNEIGLPSGGKIKLTMESDDYQYVQNKKAMRMYKVLGVTDGEDDPIRTSLYNSSGDDAKYVVVRIENPAPTEAETIRRCTEGLIGKPIYFDFFLNMAPSKYDHVTGYFEMDDGVPPTIKNIDNYMCLYIPMKHTNREGTGGSLTNPISVTGWFFGRQNLHRQVYDLPEPSDGIPNPLDLAMSIMNGLEPLIEIFIGPNGRLKNLGCARTFIPEKSWIRLNEPTGSKLGGGSRVKKVEMFDGWETMINQEDITSDIERYKKKYGQEYSYKLDDNSSSGVASFEPNMSKENPFVEPFYHGREKLSAQTYEEKPFGASFFPNPVVTYSKVSVINITAADDDDPNNETRKTRSGKVVTHHYTSYDFPTKTDFTNLDKSKVHDSNDEYLLPNLLLGMLGLNIEIKNELTMTQGFQIETNDMNGKVKKQEVFDNNNNLISYVENIYSTETDNPSALNNVLKVVDKNGVISDKAIGVEFDVVNDLRYNYNYTLAVGVNGNLEIIPIFVGPPPMFIFLFVGTAFFDNESFSQTMRAAVTTKVVHKTGILKEKRAYDLGSLVSTKNLAWDAETGQVILTETANEFDDEYYSMSFPAYWYYDRMGMASKNIDIRGKLIHPSGGTVQNPNPYFTLNSYPLSVPGNGNRTNLSDIFQLGDELYITDLISNQTKKVWVFDFNDTNTGILLMDIDGNYIDKCGSDGKDYAFRIIRSGYRNNQTASMATITSMTNPLDSGTLYNYAYTGANGETNPRIVNANAVEYKDFWEPQRELNFKIFPNTNPNGTPLSTSPEDLTFPTKFDFNPYHLNYKGNWRAFKSHAYLTGRKSVTASAASTNPRYNGFFADFNPFYSFDHQDTHKWVKNITGWTSASEVTKYSPFGLELENKDALSRYSSAQYNYTYTKPMAVVSNAEHRKIGYEGFEDFENPFGVEYATYGSTNRFGMTFLTNVSVSSEKAHTGKRSLKVTGITSPYTSTTSQITIGLQEPVKTQNLVNCIPPTPCANCPAGWYEPNCDCQVNPCGSNLSNPCAINQYGYTNFENSGSPPIGTDSGSMFLNGPNVYCFVAFAYYGNQTPTLTNNCSGSSSIVMLDQGDVNYANLNTSNCSPSGAVRYRVYALLFPYNPNSNFIERVNLTFTQCNGAQVNTDFGIYRSAGSSSSVGIHGGYMYNGKPACQDSPY